MDCIDVACALIVESGKILACQRGVDSDHPNEWEFPGGKVEAGETANECIVREINEELGIIVKVDRRLEPVEHDYGFKHIRLIPFICRVEKGVPVAYEHKTIKWHPVNDFDNLHWSTADHKLFYRNKTLFKW